MSYFSQRYFLLLFSLLFISSSAQETNDPQVNAIDFSMVISGGVSLGAYEAGYNWSVLKILTKIRETNTHVRPELRSVTGASAGAINALLTAMYWCQKDSVSLHNSVEDNFFYDTWVDLGIDDLMIRGDDPQNKSTLFTRKALEKKAAHIMHHLDEPIYRKGCEVPMGFSVTKVIPIVEDVKGISIKNQHFSVPFTFKENNSKIAIQNKQMPPSNDFYISIPGIENDTGKITDVLFASSAFPGAFQQVKLNYAYKGKKYSHYFIDGGAYANVPLQLAIELNSKASFFFFMDPSNMRKKCHTKKIEEEEKIPVGFLRTNALPLLSSFEIYQSMKLYQAINQYFRNTDSRTLILSSRYHPLTGKYLEHFAAFLDKNFRVYDYYVGVYDAIYHLASSMKKRGLYKHFSQIELMDYFKTQLGIDNNREALAAYKLFLDTEFRHLKPKTTDRFSAIYNAFDLQKCENKRYDTDEFKTFLTKLDLKYLDTSESKFLHNAKKDSNNWYKKPLRVVVERITTLENDRAKVYRDYASTARAITLASWVGSTFYKEKDGFEFLPMNVPENEGHSTLKSVLQFLPGEIAADIKNGGPSFGYYALYYMNLEYLSGIEGKASFVFANDAPNFMRADLSLFKGYDDFLTFGAGISFFGDMEGDFYKQETAYGFNTYVDLLDIFRLTYVKRAGGLENSNYFYFGIENIPSLIYWLNR